MTETAWIYCAVSSEEQAANLTNDQLAWATQTAELHRWEVTRTFGDDDDGVGSGAKSIRKILDRVLSELESTPKAKRPKRIILTRVDRLGREVLDVIGAIAKIRNLGVILHTREDGDVTIDRASDTLKPILRAITGALENEARSDKWKAVHARRKAAGLHVGIVPFGVVLIDGRATPYEPEASLVCQMFERAADGWGYTRLARWMKEAAPVKRLSDGSTKPLSWAPSSIKSLLKSQTIRAVVVPEELWKRAWAARAQDFRARAAKRWPWPLLGAVRCTCGKMLTGHCAGKDPWRTRYYICRHHTLEAGQKSHPSHRADALEAAFVEVLRRLTAEPHLFLEAEKLNTSALQKSERELKSALGEYDKRRQNVWNLAEQGNLSGPQLRERLDEIDADRNRTKSELARLRTAIDEAERVSRASQSVSNILAILEESWYHADVSQRQEIARAVAALPAVDGLYADPEKRNALIVGSDVAKRRKADALHIMATSGLLLRLAQGVVLVSKPPS